MCGFSKDILNFKLSSLFLREFEFAEKIVSTSCTSEISEVNFDLLDSLCILGKLGCMSCFAVPRFGMYMELCWELSFELGQLDTCAASPVLLVHFGSLVETWPLPVLLSVLQDAECSDDWPRVDLKMSVVCCSSFALDHLCGL